MYAGIVSLQFDKNDKDESEVFGMNSREGEQVRF